VALPRLAFSPKSLGRASTSHVYPPPLPLRSRPPPKGDDWLHEPKWDGFRFAVIKDGSDVHLYSKRGAEYSDRLPGMAEAFAKLPTSAVILDGELVLIDPRGAAHFYRLMAQMRTSHPDESQLIFMAFDLLHQDGVDLRALPLSERKRDLHRLCAKSRVPLRVRGKPFSMARCAIRSLQQIRFRGRRFEAPGVTLRGRTEPQLGYAEVRRLEAHQRGAA
jgi:ATP-dependent DNA ligase